MATSEEEADVWRLLKQLETLSAKTKEGDGAQIDYDMRRTSPDPKERPPWDADPPAPERRSPPREVFPQRLFVCTYGERYHLYRHLNCTSGATREPRVVTLYRVCWEARDRLVAAGVDQAL